MTIAKHLVVGLMSGTSADGVDAALIETDGEDHIRPIAAGERPYTSAERGTIRAAARRALAMAAPGPDPEIAAAERVLTIAHAEAVAALAGAAQATLIGFHGATVAHRPARGTRAQNGTARGTRAQNGTRAADGTPRGTRARDDAPPYTWQIGDAALLAQLTGRAVVHDFRSADVAAGGEGAPLAPGYHRALARACGIAGTVGVLNLGGVGNLSWFSDSAWGAFDTGPANALLDDWIARHRAGTHDADGALSAAGAVHPDVLLALSDHPWFDQPGPKSLDRDDFSADAVRGLTLADGAATLAAFTAETVRLALATLPCRLTRLLVTGGGRHNPTLMRMIAERTGLPTEPVEKVGWRGDSMEAEAFAWLAVRSLRGLPLSWPETTGVPRPTTGGSHVRPRSTD